MSLFLLMTGRGWESWELTEALGDLLSFLERGKWPRKLAKRQGYISLSDGGTSQGTRLSLSPQKQHVRHCAVSTLCSSFLTDSPLKSMISPRLLRDRVLWSFLLS
jgi:hypothetical protein